MQDMIQAAKDMFQAIQRYTKWEETRPQLLRADPCSERQSKQSKTKSELLKRNQSW